MEAHIAWPELKVLYKDDELKIRSNRRDDLNRERKRTYTVKPTTWEPLIWWLKQAKWTVKASGERNGLQGFKMAQCCITWLEMAIAFQLQMQYRLGMEGDDLYAQADIMRKLCMRIWKHAEHRIGGIKVSTKLFWRTAALVPSVKCLIGHRTGGFLRRLILDQRTWAAVARHIIAANRRDGDAPGLGYRFKLVASFKIQREEGRLKELQALSQIADAIKEKNGKRSSEEAGARQTTRIPKEPKTEVKCWF